MFRYFLRRTSMTAITLSLVGIAVFLIMRMIPGDPASLMLGESATDAQLQILRSRWGLDRPLPIQFGYWLASVLSGDFGISTRTGQIVLPLILDRFAVTASIVVLAVFIAVAIAVPAGMIAAWRQNSLIDIVAVAVATLLLSIPSFWLGLIMLLIFGLKLGWVPVLGFVGFDENLFRAASFIILPVITLALIETGVLIRMARASTIEVLRLEYVTHARAKGVPEWRVLLRHVFPNAFAPTLTLIGLMIGNLLGGIAVLETVFTLPGIGRLLVESIFARDYPVVQGCLLLTATVFVLINLIVDLLYPVFDPRVTVE
ncbi:ABC transporter permease [Mesorhizobium sp. YR577]|uniref:ABC transporter permease n=1 Tax=Mesorhizobium sp. YR577 TaxID=1884373 RepID=UPI0008F12093|nr:ABC transporter permease [Mesorhizobium sp. YR577]SFU23144.1 peptide/nickel transport system permease protein [Mesorhizobium sp. YR577]